MKRDFFGLHRGVVFSIATVILLMQGCFLSIEGIAYWHIRSSQTKAFLNRLFENEGHAVPMMDFHDKKPSFLGSEISPHQKPPEIPFAFSYDSDTVRRFSENITRYIFPSGKEGDDFHLYFATRTAPDGSLLELITDFPYDSSASDMVDLLKTIRTVSSLEKKWGVCGNFFYDRRERSYGYLTVYIDFHRELEEQRCFFARVILVLFVSLFFSFVAILAINIFVLRPLKKAFDAQKRFISDAGHELKTPIAAISANLEVLKGEVPNNKWVDYIAEENDRMNNLVKDLMYLAHSDARREKLVMENVNISDAITFAVLPLESLIFEKGKKLVMNVEPDMYLLCDEKKIKQLLVILVDNAVKNSDKGDVITVSADKKDGAIVIKVHNTGWGIKSEELKKIFRRFYRVDTSRNRQTGGYGLGLSIASAIVSEHHGKISADSEFGKWAEFSIVLPFLKRERR